MEDVKKLERKRKRFAVRLKASREINCTDEPCPNIVLCNMGQATGLEKRIITDLLEKLGGMKLVKFIAEKGESHSFLVFNNKSDAEIFYYAYNGKTSIDSATPVYMSFVQKVPNTEVICPYKNPNGLTILDNFICQEEEKMLFELFDWVEESNLKNRQVKHYGYEFRYGSNDVDLQSPLDEKIPEQCDLLWQRLRKCGVDFEIPDQLTVNKYNPGQGIPSHVDRHSPFGDTILSLSLGASVVMDWKNHSGKYVPVVVARRSLLVMQGEARYDWQHGIQPRSWDPIIETRIDSEPVKVITNDTIPRGTRISLTFRKTREGPCDCQYKVLCDSVSRSEKIEDDIAAYLEELHVHQVYEQIAGHFSSTRHTPWPKVVEFLRDAAPGSVLLDLGAGNGKNILPRSDILQIAGERSDNLLEECRSYTRGVGGADCVRLDVLHAGLKDECADAIICIAVIHHFSNAARRKQAVATIARLLRPGGRALITVWAKDQTKSNYLCKGKEGNSTLFPTVGGLNLPVHENRTQFQHNDLLVPWKLRRKQGDKLSNQSENTLLRYYHVFEEGELDTLCDLPNLSVENSFYEEGNWCVICTKV